MRFRPCIDIHNGKVKQIVGGTLPDETGSPSPLPGEEAPGPIENFVSGRDAAWFADLYRQHELPGGHIILLNAPGTEHYEESLAQAKAALAAYPEGLQIGGGINPENAQDFIEAGASHVIVTSYVFRDGQIDFDRLLEMVAAVGRDRLVLDLSCKKKGDDYFIVTNRWQTYTDVALSPEVLSELGEHCDEFLIHAVDVEGRQAGIDERLISLLADYAADGIPGEAGAVPDEGLAPLSAAPTVPVTYAGGISSLEDIALLRELSRGSLDFTIGSALDLFGGPILFADVLDALM